MQRVTNQTGIAMGEQETLPKVNEIEISHVAFNQPILLGHNMAVAYT